MNSRQFSIFNFQFSIFNRFLLSALLLAISAFTCRAEETAAPPPASTPAPAPKPDTSAVSPGTSNPVTIVVTASRLPEPIQQTGVSIDVIDGKEDHDIDQHIQFSDSLRQTPGVTVSRSGLQGDFTTLFTRGGNSNQTLFLYDGWKVNRQGGNFNLAAIDPVQLDRIEIARGPSSSLYGTDAVTGTINVLTAKGAGRPLLTTSGAGGTFGTDYETLQMQGNEKAFSYNISGSRLHRTEATFENSELEVYNYAARFDYQFNPDHALKAIIRGSDDHKGFYEDSGSGYGTAIEPPDPNDQIKQRDLLTGLEYHGHVMPIWDTTLRLGHYLFDLRSISEAPNPVSTVAGFAQSTGRTFTQERRPSLDWQNDVTAYAAEDGKIKDIVTVGTSFEQERFNQDDTQFGADENIKRSNWSIFAQNRLELYDRAFLAAGVRREQNGQFGDFVTARMDAAVLIPESETRIHGSVGDAFRAPSFFEAFSSFGNPSLHPEKNTAYDVGIEQHFWKRRITLNATWFNNDFKDLINFDLAGNTFENLATANTRGLEFSASIKPIKKITLSGAATLQHTEDDLGRHLQRRPGSNYSGHIIAHPVEHLDLSLSVLHEGPRGDLGPTPKNAFARVRNGSFTRVDAAVSYRFFTHWRAYARIENVLNESYEEVKTFPSPGSSTMAGIEFNWRF